jgi:hypothetical protein
MVCNDAGSVGAMTAVTVKSAGNYSAGYVRRKRSS